MALIVNSRKSTNTNVPKLDHPSKPQKVYIRCCPSSMVPSKTSNMNPYTKTIIQLINYQLSQMLKLLEKGGLNY